MTTKPEPLFPGVEWGQPYASNYGPEPSFIATFCGNAAKVRVLKTGEYSVSFGGNLCDAKPPDAALTWLRTQCLTRLRADVERTGHLMVTREQLEELENAAADLVCATCLLDLATAERRLKNIHRAIGLEKP